VKKDAILYLIFHRNLVQIPAKIIAVVLVKKCKNQTFFYSHKFRRNFGRNSCFLHRRIDPSKQMLVNKEILKSKVRYTLDGFGINVVIFL
jgi:hypothetical protein